MMITHSSHQHVSVKPQQTGLRSSYLYDLGNGNFLDSMPFPAMSKLFSVSDDAANASVLPYQEYHGALEKPAKSGTRRYTVSIASHPQHGPSSWSEVPKLYDDTPSDDDVISSPSSSDEVPSQTDVESIPSPTASPSQDLNIDRSFSPILYSPTQFFETIHGCADDGPIEFMPPIYPNFTTNHQLHPYLFSPPFRHSFWRHPHRLYQLGFVRLYDSATTPPIFKMNIRSPFLPWSIELCQADYITVYNVLCAIFELLHQIPTQAELDMIYSKSGARRKYRKIITACRKRSDQGNSDQQSGEYVKIDWLSGKHIFDGLAARDDEKGPFWRLRFRT